MIRNRIFTVLTAASLVSLAACGGGEEGAGEGTTVDTTTTTTTTDMGGTAPMPMDTTTMGGAAPDPDGHHRHGRRHRPGRLVKIDSTGARP